MQIRSQVNQLRISFRGLKGPLSPGREKRAGKCQIFLHNLKFYIFSHNCATFKLTVIDLQEQIVTGTVSWNLITPSVSSLNENICIVLYWRWSIFKDRNDYLVRKQTKSGGGAVLLNNGGAIPAVAHFIIWFPFPFLRPPYTIPSSPFQPFGQTNGAAVKSHSTAHSYNTLHSMPSVMRLSSVLVSMTKVSGEQCVLHSAQLCPASTIPQT